MAHRVAAFALVLVLLLLQAAEAQSFRGLGLLPGRGYSQATAVSDDGSVVVGASGYTTPYEEAFRWTTSEGLVGLGYLSADGAGSRAHDISADGSVVVGHSFSLTNWDSFRWTVPDGMSALVKTFGFNSTATAVSSDASVVVGYNNIGGGYQSFRWTGAGGMIQLSPQALSMASGVSADGSFIVGCYRRGFDEHGYEVWEAAAWTTWDNLIPLGDLPGGAFYSWANGVSDDGSVIVGQSDSSSGTQAFRWTAASGMIGLGSVPGDNPWSNALAASADGSVVVGGDLYGGAFIWDEAHGKRSLQDVLVNDFGMDLSGWSLSSATAISADGKSIVGHGMSAAGIEAWRATIPEPSTFVQLACGVVMLWACSRLRRKRL